ncbi:MAG: prevent-host-death protein [Thiotrichaceae bacterium IS1]|nr:MAG: prevent-host-death protein [Thiotrichaceae bacterium IS1]
MIVYTFSQARQNLSKVFEQAQIDEVVIKRKDGSLFAIVPKPIQSSPFAVAGIKTQATTEDIMEAIRDSRKPV